MESIFSPDLFISTDYKTITFTYKSLSQTLYCSNSSTTDFDLTGQIIWPASEYLAKYIVDNSELFLNKNVLEVGSGAGLSGLVSSQFTKKSYLTDGNPIILDLLELNKHFSGSKNVEILKLEWGIEETQKILDSIGSIDIIIGADVLFWPDSIKPLILSLKEIIKRNKEVLILISMCYRAKHSEELLMATIKEEGLKREVIQNDNNIFLFKIVENM